MICDEIDDWRCSITVTAKQLRDLRIEPRSFACSSIHRYLRDAKPRRSHSSRF
jgi:hypothetical protein